MFNILDFYKFKSNYKLSFRDISVIFKTDRNTIVNWYNGKLLPNDNDIYNIELYNSLYENIFIYNGISNYVNRVITDGKTFLELISSNQLSISIACDKLLKIVKTENEQRELLKRNLNV